MALDENEAGDKKFLHPRKNNHAICHRDQQFLQSRQYEQLLGGDGPKEPWGLILPYSFLI